MLQALDWSQSWSAAAALAFGYLLGSIPFGLILTRLAGTQDIRSIGSGNIGATNVLRTGRKGLAAATLLGDMLKGTLAVAHRPAFLRPRACAVRGGGRVSRPPLSGLAQLQGRQGRRDLYRRAARPRLARRLAMCLIWLAVAALTRYSSLAALVASVLTPGVLLALGERPEAVLFALLTALLWIMHRANIARLIAGTEGRIGERSAAGG